MTQLSETRGFYQDSKVDLEKFNSIQAADQAGHLSGKYSFIPTTRVISALESKNWFPVKAQEVRCRKAETMGFQKHLIRFRNPDLSPMDIIKDAIYPEIVLTNSHDGLASFNLMAGLFRVICANGLIVADSMFNTMRIRHMGYTDQAVHEAIEGITDTIPTINNSVRDFQSIELTPDERGIYAAAALEIKYTPEEMAERKDLIKIDRLLSSNRSADSLPTLWNTFNVIQEKFIKGGKFAVKDTGYGYQRSRKVRGVNSITENVRLNKALWTLTEKMAELKKSA
jgi:hypothetical protein